MLIIAKVLYTGEKVAEYINAKRDIMNIDNFSFVLEFLRLNFLEGFAPLFYAHF